MDIFVARQPIFNRHQEVIAYELLYRDSDQNFFSGNVTSDVATSILLMNSYLNFGISHLVGHHKAFLNFEKELVMNDIPQLLDKSNVVIELLEDVVPDQAFMNKIKDLKSSGYTIAIDDFVEDYAYNDLVDLCDIIKVEFLGESRKSIEKICRTWKPKGKLLLAEKVETREEYEWAKSIGFDYFQGYFFSKPSMIRSKSVKDDSSSYIRLMTALNADEPDYNEITSFIELNVGLTYKLLKLVNSRFVKSNTISSIKHAVSMLGIRSLRKWVSLALVQTMSTNETSELIVTSMVRSHLLESIARNSNFKTHSDELTLMGILSILDVMLKRPMAELLEELPVADTIKSALVGEPSLYTPIYTICMSYEQGDFSNLAENCALIDYDTNALPSHYIEAVKWADETYKYMYTDL